MNTLIRGLRMAAYTLSLLVIGFLWNCSNAALMEDIPAIPDANGVMQKTPGTSIEPNFKIVLKTVTEDHRGHEYGRHEEHGKEHEKDRYGHHRDVSLDRIYITIKRIDVLTAKGWITIQEELDKYGKSLELPMKAGVETEVLQTAVEPGEYTKIKIYLSDDNYVVLSNEPGKLHPLVFKKEKEEHCSDHDKKGHDHGKSAFVTDEKGHRLKVKHFQPVTVEKGYISVVYLEVEIDELVEYNRKSNSFILDPETRFIESVLFPVMTKEAANETAKGFDPLADQQVAFK